MRKLVKRVIERAIHRGEADPREREVSLTMRLANRVAGIVFPTNKSGNNMSVR